MNSSKLFFYEPISFDSLLPGGPSSVFNQICFVLFMSLTSNTSCKMMKSSLAENIDELRDDTFVSKLHLESSIYFDPSRFIFEVTVFVMIKCLPKFSD